MVVSDQGKFLLERRPHGKDFLPKCISILDSRCRIIYNHE
jgi:hypothetical protein